MYEDSISNNDIHTIDTIKLTIEPLEEKGFVLDIGGGGEGVIGLINGSKVVSIDLLKDELSETENDSLKIIMDASDMKFLENTFDAVTAFYSFMYIPINKRQKVFEEAYRVLKKEAKLYLWDTKIEEIDSFGKEIVMVQCEINTSIKDIKTGYGIKWKNREQDSAVLTQLARNAGFILSEDRSKDKRIELIFKK